MDALIPICPEMASFGIQASKTSVRLSSEGTEQLLEVDSCLVELAILNVEVFEQLFPDTGRIEYSPTSATSTLPVNPFSEHPHIVSHS